MAKRTISERLLSYFDELSLDHIELPDDIGVLDPFNGPQSETVKRIVSEFHEKFYSDTKERRLMLGINPGRLGAGSTGLSFTDTKRCEQVLGIDVPGMNTYEPSSDFFYRVIKAAGGPERFYSEVYVHSVCPLGFVVRKKNGSEVNINYYDRKELQEALEPFIISWLRDLIEMGFKTDIVYCIGTGKNTSFLRKLNDSHGFFDQVIALEHPRYVMQYKRKTMSRFIDKYLEAVFGM